MTRIDVVCASPPTLTRVTLPNGEVYTYRKVCGLMATRAHVQITTCVLHPFSADRYITNTGQMEITCEKSKCTAVIELLFSDEHGRHEARGTVRMSDAITKQMEVSTRARE